MKTKQDLVSEVAKITGLTKKDAGLAVNTTFEVISDYLEKGETVRLIGYGNFEVRKRAERKGRNPQTGEEIIIPASKTPAFKAGKALKERLNT